MNDASLFRFFQVLQERQPHPATELRYGNNFQLLLAVMFSAQSTDIAVNKVTTALFAKVRSPQELIQFTEVRLSAQIQTLGLYRTKARHAIEMAHILLQQHSGEVPCNRLALEALPGVGRKTANVLLNVAFGNPTLAVDTHVARVAVRTGIVPPALKGKVLAIEKKLVQRIPDQFLHHAHNWLILHGRYVCQAKKPRCTSCPVLDCCDQQL